MGRRPKRIAGPFVYEAIYLGINPMKSMNVVTYLPPKNTNSLDMGDLEQAGYTEPGWYFWDEVQFNCYGPYASEGEANSRALEYADSIYWPKSYNEKN